MEEIVYESQTFSKVEQPANNHVNRLVWLKQPDYPWWPGIIIPAESAGLTLPDDKDLCILCFPSNASTVAFGQSNDVDEVRIFNGKRDVDLIREGEKNTECAIAINEALNMFESQQETHANSNHNDEHEYSENNSISENNESNKLFGLKGQKELELEVEENGSNVFNSSDNNNILDNSLNEVNNVGAVQESEVITNILEQTATMIMKDNNMVANKDIDLNVPQKESRHRHKRERERTHRHHRHKREKTEQEYESKRSSKKHKKHRISKKMKNKEELETEENYEKEEEESEQEEETEAAAAAASLSEESLEESEERKHVYVMEKDAQARQSRLDEYEFEAQQPPQHYIRRKSHQKKENINGNRRNNNKEYNENTYNDEDREDEDEEEDDAHYYYRKCRESRTRVPSTFLETTGAELRRVIAICLNDSLFEEHEEVILFLLRPLTKCDVTLEQLQETHIGIIVGQLLMKSFPLRVNQLAHAILTYWFRSLPSSLQANFVEDNEIDRCSIDTTAGSRSSDAHPTLGAVGVHIFESFTDEELDDTPPQIDVIELCKEFETVLQSGNDDHDTRVQVLSEIGSSKNGELRRALLDGKITVQEVIRNVNDLPRLLHRFHRSRLRRSNTSTLALRTSGLAGDDTDASHSPSSPFSPMMGESTSNLSESVASPTLRSGLGNITTMYTCPNCGAQEAYRTVYTVAAHDNFPDILRCKQCGTTWNISEQPS